jgi:Ca-activated chloride channel family protein
MKQIAAITKGKYFRANSNEKLEAIYKEIDALEKSIIKEEKHIQFDENYRPWVLVALFFLLAEFVLNRTVFKSFI